MSLIAKLRWHLFGIRDEVIDRTEQTIKLARESRKETAQVNDLLRSYANRAKPLVSMMGDLYNQREIEKIWQGPPRQ
jgi:hypothetical protein